MNIGVNRTMVGDDDVLFEPSSWHIKIDFINQFILNNNVLISVLGEKGTGKTTFSRLLRDTLASQVHSVLLVATPLFESIPFVENLCLQLELDAKLSFGEIVNEINSRQTRTLIIIDNAEELPEAFITEILDALKTQDGSGFCHVCLLSDFSLVEMTSRLARDTYTDMIHSIELQPLNEAETKAYVKTRMAALDSEMPEPSDQLLEEFYELTEGNIMGINTQMIGFFASKFEQKAPLYKRYLSYGYIPVLAVAVAGGVYVLSSQAPISATESTQLVENNMQTAQLELPLTSEIPFYSVASVHQPLETIAIQQVDIQTVNEKTDESMDVSSTTIATADSNQSIEMAEETSSVQKVVVAQSTIEPHVTANKLARKKAVAKPTVVHGSAKKGAPSGQFTIQLLATRDKSELTRLTKRFSSKDGFKVRRFDNQGTIWYVLTRGDFTQKQLAQHALTTLPPNLAQMKPWVRSTENLQNIG